jgi:hypothetical protein
MNPGRERFRSVSAKTETLAKILEWITATEHLRTQLKRLCIYPEQHDHPYRERSVS